MASSPLRAPAAAAAGPQQSRLLEMQKKFQQKHLATVKNAATVSKVPAAITTTTTTTVIPDIGGGHPPAPPVRRFGGTGAGAGLQQRKIVGAIGAGGAGVGAGTGPLTLGDDNTDSPVQVDVKGKQLQRPTGRINSKTATIAKKPPVTVNGNSPAGGLGRGVKKTTYNGGGGANAGANGGAKPLGTNRLLLPPVVQPTVIHALVAGAGAAAAVASVSEAAASGPQKPWARPARLPPATVGQQQQKSTTSPRQHVTPTPAKAANHQPKPITRRMPAAQATPAAPVARPRSVKKQLSEDRGPPAKGMARCPLCARDFAADRLPKHEEVCRRTRERERKRKVFDTSKKRLEAVAAEAGVDVASFKKKSQKEDQRAAEKLQKKKDAWRRKHDQLVRNVRAARAVQQHLAAGGTMRDLPPELDNAGADQNDEIDSDLVKCPHCGRTFNEASAERHMPLCAERQRNAAARTQNKKR